MGFSTGTRHQTTRRTTGRGGFTVTELLMVIVMIGILGAVMVPRITRLTARNKASEASAVVQRDLERAFSIAARLRRAVVLTADNAGLYYQISDAAKGTVRLNRNLRQGAEVGVETMTFSPTTITVQPNGIASAPLTVTLSSHGAVRTITMTRVGLIRRTR